MKTFMKVSLVAIVSLLLSLLLNPSLLGKASTPEKIHKHIATDVKPHMDALHPMREKMKHT